MVKKAKDFRISKRKEITFILHNGKRIKENLFSVIFLENNSGHDRAAVLVSRANGNAVKRNRIKRVYREIFNTTKSGNPPFFDILIKPIGSFLPPSNEIKDIFFSWKTVVKK